MSLDFVLGIQDLSEFQNMLDGLPENCTDFNALPIIHDTFDLSTLSDAKRQK